MGLFPSSKDFKDGPGVEKDTPRKTGVGRFFELVGRDMSSMFLANLLTCIGFLPVICLVYIGFLMNNLTVMIVSAIAGGILAGPALAGVYDTVLRALRDEAGYWWTTYRRAFRQNFKASILPGILYCVVVTVQIPGLFLLQHAVPRHQRGRSHVGGHGAEPCAVPHAVFLHVAPDRAAGSALQPDREKQHQLHDRIPAPRAGRSAGHHPVLGSGDPVHAAGPAADAGVRLLVPVRDLLPDRLRRPEPGVPH